MTADFPCGIWLSIYPYVHPSPIYAVYRSMELPPESVAQRRYVYRARIGQWFQKQRSPESANAHNFMYAVT